jgi:hypothetical protein
LLIKKETKINVKKFTSEPATKVNYVEVNQNVYDVILAMTSNDLLRVSIESILRPKMKWIQEESSWLS